MPVFPILCLLAAYAVVVLAVDALGRRRPALRPALLALGAVALCGQGLVYSRARGLVLSRPDTRNLARDWMVANVPRAPRSSSSRWCPTRGRRTSAHPLGADRQRRPLVKFPTSRTNVASDGSIEPARAEW